MRCERVEVVEARGLRGVAGYDGVPGRDGGEFVRVEDRRALSQELYASVHGGVRENASLVVLSRFSPFGPGAEQRIGLLRPLERL